ncbi:MAG: YfhO family protein [Lachnospiraceae bacterium]|nr:YfhO family protein [Lachnospiraceae bacterium]
MAYEDIHRITKELEDLLMTNRERESMWEEELPKQLDRQDEICREEEDAQEQDIVGEEEEIVPEEEDSVAISAKRHFEAGGGTWSLIRPNDGWIAAFVVPMVILLIIFAQRGIYPFGEESFLRTDMYHQYAPFFSEFRNKLANGESLLYSWNVGMGVNFSALYAYYLASPLNCLLILCPEKYVIEFMTYMIVLKTGLSGLSMAYYLRKHCKSDNPGVGFFGIFYALSGYMAAYSWNIMWLDCIILFPLIMLGLERLVKEGRGLFYCLTLGISIFSNYYISIMTCIFMVLYFVALLALETKMTWEKFVGRCAAFAFYSLVAGGLAAVVLLPEIYALMMTASGKFNFPKLQDPYFPIFDMLARHIGNVESEIGLDHWPNIFCGVAVLMFLPLYWISKKISGREKVVYSVLLLFFLASFSINVLNFIWHGFHFPNSLPCRQSYIYIFLVLVMCCKAYLQLAEISWKNVLLAFWGAVGFVLLAQKLVTEEHFHFSVFYVAILFLALYLWILWLYKKRPHFRNRAVLLALILVAMEAAVNMTVTSVTTTSRTAYIKDNESVRKLVDSVLPSDTFFRMEKVTRKTKNDGAWMNFPSVSLFSSTANADLTKLFKKLGCESSTNAYSITGSTPLIDMLFAVRYGIYSEEPVDTGMRDFVAREEDTVLYRNTYTLPLGFLVSEDFEQYWDREMVNPADVQNNLAGSVGAEPVLVLEMDVSSSGEGLTFCPEEGGEYYVYVSDTSIEKVTAETWRGTKTYNNVNRGYLLEMGYCTAGDLVTLKTEDSADGIWADVYRFSETGLAQVCERLSAVPWKLESWQETRLEGTISAEEGGVMLTTIPYDEGWTVLVDGEEHPKEKLLDAFVGVALTPGTHKISMSYRPEGLVKGGMITIGCVVLLLAVECICRFWRRRRWEEEKIWEEEVGEEEISEGEIPEQE